ncbi:2-deoxyribose-5-phosphate aldolase [Pseudalgibacter alginicilyticus]|uniref:Deoxyribose-phosphate aldolase n=1 Tax=Pseudalgibacter alginicilyticus TaxID=1736674 RepID=A0A0N7HY54_9FLAO|nr:deoxyribose-phosphate aldolase [Pseudalgibacter alginicilyticus]ALJ04302.1 2-deoxyribose-5-phosphate aldolase [Pseudalgibacter alginicilyticus]
MDISNYIDFTLLHATTTERDIIDFCYKAKENKFYAVCVNSAYVPLAKQLLENTNIKISSVIGFPLGATSTAAKIFEAKKAIDDGADEIEMVINIGLVKSKNYVSVLRDITDVKIAIGKTPLKVILEISELNKNEVIKASEICIDANADYIKTSTGFSKNGATLTVVKIIKKTVRNKIKIIAFDGINDYETALKYIDAGVERIGTILPIETTENSLQIRNTKIYRRYIETVQNSDYSMPIQQKKQILE